MADAQQQINLTAGPTTANMPDGSTGADVGLQLRRGRDWLDGDLRGPLNPAATDVARSGRRS